MNTSLLFFLSLSSLLIMSLAAYAQQIVECNPEDENGVCLEDIIYHRCQIIKDNGVSQTIVLGKCENVEKDIDDDGDKETICKCVEEPSSIKKTNKEDRQDFTNVNNPVEATDVDESDDESGDESNDESGDESDDESDDEEQGSNNTHRSPNSWQGSNNSKRSSNARN